MIDLILTALWLVVALLGSLALWLYALFLVPWGKLWEDVTDALSSAWDSLRRKRDR